MSVYCSREGAKTWFGITPSPEVHHYYKDTYDKSFKIFTWKELFEERTKKQEYRI